MCARVPRAAGLVAGLLAALLVLAAAPAAWAARPADVLVPAHGALFGANTQDAAGHASEYAVGELENELGRRLDIDHYYRQWNDLFPDGREQTDFANGRIPMISWAKADTAEIASGADDNLIRTRAAAVAALGHPLFIRWFWEMDGERNAAVTRSPADYIAAWRHIHDLFEAAGASNVAWVWCPNAFNFATGQAQQYYPGDDDVDWICADGYDWYPAVSGADDNSFASVFRSFYDWGTHESKPLVVGEYGALESGTDHKANWLDAARTTLETEYTRIAAVVYFNHDGLDPTSGIDWRVETSPSAQAAFAAMAEDPYFNPTLAPAPGLAAPGDPPHPPADVPEAPWPVALPVSALLVVASLSWNRRRRGAFGGFTSGPDAGH